MSKDEKTYRTIENPPDGLYKEKGSKFIALAWPVNNEKQIKLILNNISREHHKSRHICYAYKIRPDATLQGE